MMDPIRVALLGAGLIGRRHLEFISASPRFELVGIVDPSADAASQAERYQVPVLDTLGRLLAEIAPDAVIIATPNRLHAEQAIQCIEAGVPVLVEKPVADSYDQALRIADTAEARGVPVLVGHHRRHSPTLALAKEVVDSGELGDLVAVSGTAIFYKPDAYFDAGPWRRSSAGGPILINLVHEIDDLRMLCGDIDEVSVLASNARRGFEVEDTAAIGLRFANGALGTFLLSDTASAVLSWENLSGEDPAFPRYADEDCYVIAGTRGALSVPTMRLRTVSGVPSWWEPMLERRLDVSVGNPLELQLEHFGAVVRGESAPLVTARDAAETLHIIQQIIDGVQIGVAS